ncbi:hypothetical protein ACFL2V_20245 [Pseudomonadota bacterium]
MKNRKFISVMAAVAVSLSLFAGCQSAPAPDKDADEVISEAFENGRNVLSHTYDVDAKADLKAEGEMFNLNLLLSGVIDANDPKDPKFTVKFKGSVDDGMGTDGTADGELRLNDKAVYLFLKDLNITGEEMPEELTEMFGKWWNIPLPPEALEELEANLTLSGNAELTEEQEEILAMVEEAFSDPKYTGTENIKGEPSWAYEVELDTNALIDVMKRYSEAQGETVSEEDIAKAREDLKDVVVKGKLWVGTKSNVITQMYIDLMFTGDGQEVPSGNITATITIGDVGNPQNVDTPSDSEEFPMEMLLGPMMMMDGAVPTGEGGIPADAMMFDESSLAGMEGGEFTEEDLAELEELMKDLEAMEQ